MTRTIAIRHGDLSAEIVPSLGTGLARFDHGCAPLFRPWPDGGSTNPFDPACDLLEIASLAAASPSTADSTNCSPTLPANPFPNGASATDGNFIIYLYKPPLNYYCD